MRSPSLWRVVAPCLVATVLAATGVRASAGAGDTDTERMESRMERRMDRLEERIEGLYRLAGAIGLLGLGTGGVLAYRENTGQRGRREEDRK